MNQMTESPLWDRFWSKVNKQGPNDCWEWTACKNKKGYGWFGLNGRTQFAHRSIWFMTYNYWPECCCHSCDNPSCVNIAHLFEATNAENIADMVCKGRQAKGEKNGQVKLTQEQVKEIRKRYAAGGVFQKELAREYGISNQQISKIVNRIWWKHIK